MIITNPLTGNLASVKIKEGKITNYTEILSRDAGVITCKVDPESTDGFTVTFNDSIVTFADTLDEALQGAELYIQTCQGGLQFPDGKTKFLAPNPDRIINRYLDVKVNPYTRNNIFLTYEMGTLIHYRETLKLGDVVVAEMDSGGIATARLEYGQGFIEIASDYHTSIDDALADLSHMLRENKSSTYSSDGSVRWGYHPLT